MEQCPKCRKYVVTAEDIADGWLECGKCGYSGQLDIDPPAELESGEREYIMASFGY